uniref:Tetratricopeptide SHNi-TPR domain-containing protein n=1 Tax=Wuchereria bancrofti TaxID=6293 RepID=A0A1I8EFU6_WUCBA
MVPTSRNDESVEKKDEGDVVRFQTLLAEGKQAYISGKFKEAEIKLGEAAELSVNIYGYFAIPTFDPHLYYGKTLLELARLEDGVFSNALQGIAATDEEACKQQNEKDGSIEEMKSLTEKKIAEITEKIGNALEENADVLKGRIACCHENGTDIHVDNNETNITMENDGSNMEKEQMKRCCAVESDKDEDENETMDYKEEKNKSGGKNEDEKTENENKGSDGAEDEEEDGKLGESGKDDILAVDDKGSSDAGDVEYLQLAWENLEVARTICDKHLEEEGWKEKKVEVLLDLADCSTDAENYKQAIDDIDACILLTESIFGEVDRRVAQAYFVKGRTHNLAKDFGNAAKVFGKSKEILETKLAKLEAQLAHQSEEEAEIIKKEIDELKFLLPEIQVKIDDSLESARSLTKENVVMEDNKEEVLYKSSIKGMPVDDVSNLVRKKLKRSTEDEAERKTKRTKSGDDPGNATVNTSPSSEI